MTKADFKRWLQDMLNGQAGVEDEEDAFDEIEAGDLWRDIESNDMLDDIGITLAVDHTGHDIIFRCSDGLLASGFETGLEDNTIWFFSEGHVDDNMRDYGRGDLDTALAHARVAVMDLEGLIG